MKHKPDFGAVRPRFRPHPSSVQLHDLPANRKPETRSPFAARALEWPEHSLEERRLNSQPVIGYRQHPLAGTGASCGNVYAGRSRTPESDGVPHEFPKQPGHPGAIGRDHRQGIEGYLGLPSFDCSMPRLYHGQQRDGQIDPLFPQRLEA